MKTINIFILTVFSLTFFLTACKNPTEQDNLNLTEATTDTDGCVSVKKESGIDIAFVLDSSGSMQKNDIGDLRIKKAEVIVDEMDAEDRALVISFDKEAKLISEEFTDDSEKIISAFGEIASDQKYTNLADGLMLALNKFKKEENRNQKIIIALTDGENAGETDVITKKINQDTYNHALSASNENITIYTIGLGSDVDKELLENVATISGGKYFNAKDNFDLEDVYRNVTEELNCLAKVESEKKNDRYVVFEDKNLKQYINSLLEFEPDYNPTEKDLENITNISFENLDSDTVSSLEGLQYAVNLETINLHDQNLSDLSPLLKLINLKNIEINNNNLGLINLLSEKEKQLYANYLVEKFNKESNTNLLNGQILDANKDGLKDVLFIYSKQCEFPEYDCIYIEIVTNNSGTLEVLYDTNKHANDAQNHIFNVGGGLANTSVYIKNMNEDFDLVISTSGGSSANHGEYYQYISLDANREFSYEATNLYASYCSSGNEGCEEVTQYEKVKGNINMEYINNIIDTEKRIEFEDVSQFFDKIYPFATVELLVNESLLPTEGKILSYERGFTEEKGTFIVKKEGEFTILTSLGDTMSSDYSYYEDETSFVFGVSSTDWIFLSFDSMSLETVKTESFDGEFPGFGLEYGAIKDIKTDETISVKAGTFQNVTIFISDTHRVYVAPGYGIIKVEDNNGNIVTELVDIN